MRSVLADAVTTSVTVGNSAPSITAGPAESPASYATTPTNVGDNVTFQATATDSNSENYYLAICKTNSVTPVNGGAPTCGGGNWCISTTTTSGSQASCTYTALVGDAQSNVWYAFVCDGNSSAACSASSQGTGDSGSPFKVNHRPTFATITNDSPKDPGVNITWSTNSSTLDSDNDTTPDTVKLIICKTTGITNDDCDGGASDRWCASSYVASNPSCAYSIPSVTVDGSNNAYAYLVDNHYFGASTNQGSASNFTVNNVSPTVTSVVLNSSGAITLTEGTTTNVTVTGTVTDNNSCTDLSTVTTSAYRSGVTYTSCDDNAEDDDNDCYAVVSCSVSGGSCEGTSDASADYTCTVTLQYHADPTTANTVYSAENWDATILATDDDAATGTADATNVEMNTTTALDVTASIAYGSLNVGQSNDPLDKITTVTATGNVGLDEELSGTAMTGGGSIAASYQHYALASSTAYASGTALSSSPTEAELNCQKTISSASPKTKDTWWGLLIPTGTPTGAYSGSNTVTAVLGETANW